MLASEDEDIGVEPRLLVPPPPLSQTPSSPLPLYVVACPACSEELHGDGPPPGAPEPSRMPYLLQPCAHSVCADCISAMMLAASVGTNPLCPVCATPFVGMCVDNGVASLARTVQACRNDTAGEVATIQEFPLGPAGFFSSGVQRPPPEDDMPPRTATLANDVPALVRATKVGLLEHAADHVMAATAVVAAAEQALGAEVQGALVRVDELADHLCTELTTAIRADASHTKDAIRSLSSAKSKALQAQHDALRVTAEQLVCVARQGRAGWGGDSEPLVNAWDRWVDKTLPLVQTQLAPCTSSVVRVVPLITTADVVGPSQHAFGLVASEREDESRHVENGTITNNIFQTLAACNEQLRHALTSHSPADRAVVHAAVGRLAHELEAAVDRGSAWDGPNWPWVAVAVLEVFDEHLLSFMEDTTTDNSRRNHGWYIGVLRKVTARCATLEFGRECYAAVWAVLYRVMHAFLIRISWEEDAGWLMATMRHHLHVASLEVEAMACLAQYFKLVAVRTHSRTKHDAVPVLCDVLRAHPLSLPVQRAGLELLASCTPEFANAKQRKHVTTCGGPGVSAMALFVHTSDARVRTAALTVLSRCEGSPLFQGIRPSPGPHAPRFTPNQLAAVTIRTAVTLLAEPGDTLRDDVPSGCESRSIDTIDTTAAAQRHPGRGPHILTVEPAWRLVLCVLSAAFQYAANPIVLQAALDCLPTLRRFVFALEIAPCVALRTLAIHGGPPAMRAMVAAGVLGWMRIAVDEHRRTGGAPIVPLEVMKCLILSDPEQVAAVGADRALVASMLAYKGVPAEVASLEAIISAVITRDGGLAELLGPTPQDTFTESAETNFLPRAAGNVMTTSSYGTGAVVISLGSLLKFFGPNAMRPLEKALPPLRTLLLAPPVHWTPSIALRTMRIVCDTRRPHGAFGAAACAEMLDALVQFVPPTPGGAWHDTYWFQRETITVPHQRRMPGARLVMKMKRPNPGPWLGDGEQDHSNPVPPPIPLVAHVFRQFMESELVPPDESPLLLLKTPAVDDPPATPVAFEVFLIIPNAWFCYVYCAHT